MAKMKAESSNEPPKAASAVSQPPQTVGTATRAKNADAHPGIPDKPAKRWNPVEIQAEKKAKEVEQVELASKHTQGIKSVAELEEHLCTDNKMRELYCPNLSIQWQASHSRSRSSATSSTFDEPGDLIPSPEHVLPESESDGGDMIIEQLNNNNAALDNDSSHEGNLDDPDYFESDEDPKVDENEEAEADDAVTFKHEWVEFLKFKQGQKGKKKVLTYSCLVIA